MGRGGLVVTSGGPTERAGVQMSFRSKICERKPQTYLRSWSVEGVWGTLSVFILRNREVAHLILGFEAAGD